MARSGGMHASCRGSSDQCRHSPDTGARRPLASRTSEQRILRRGSFHIGSHVSGPRRPRILPDSQERRVMARDTPPGHAMGDHTRSAGGSSGAPPETGGKQAVLVEMRVPRTPGAARAAGDPPGAAVGDVAGFELDTSYDPVRSTPTGDTARGLLGADEEVVIVRGTIDPARIPELEAHPNVLKVWRDAPIAPFVAVEAAPSREAPAPFVSPMMGFGTC